MKDEPTVTDLTVSIAVVVREGCTFTCC